MVMSMTGYGRAEIENNDFRAAIEARSVNHRFLDINVKYNGNPMPMDDRICEIIKKRFGRGSFDISLALSSDKAEYFVELDSNLLVGYMETFSKLKEKYNLTGDPSLVDILQIKDVFIKKDKHKDVEKFWPTVKEALDVALDRLTGMREKEGAHIVEDAGRRFAEIAGFLDQIRALGESSTDERFKILKARIEKLTKDKALDPNRIAQEAAMIADKSDITEEVTRLESHISQAKELLGSDDLIGRKLEFLLQEINREANTIGSKSSSPQITRIVITIKSELEKIREQAQNME